MVPSPRTLPALVTLPFEFPVEALPGTVAPGEAPKHAPVMAGVYMNQKISAVRRPVAAA